MTYTLDTNIFIDGFRNEEAQAEVFAFLKRALPFTYLSAVVMLELAAGARTPEAARNVQQGVFEPHLSEGFVTRRPGPHPATVFPVQSTGPTKLRKPRRRPSSSTRRVTD